jgi:hypothetical protein
MNDERIITRARRDFPGINRAVSANDNPDGAAISRDGRRLPAGKFVRRDEYDSLYKYRAKQYEHTTDFEVDGLVTYGDQQVAAITNTHQLYSSHGRKTVVLGISGTTEYTFTAYVEKQITAHTHTLYLHRASRTTTGLDVTWPAPTGGPGADAQRIIVTSITPNAGADLNASWIEFSMVMNTAKTIIYFLVSYHNETTNETIVQSWKIGSNLYHANFSTGAVITGMNPSIEDDLNITRDLDIELVSVGGVDQVIGFWGILDVVSGFTVFHYSIDAGGWFGTAITQYPVVPTTDIYALSFIRNESLSIPSFFLFFTETSGAERRLWSQAFYYSVGSLPPFAPYVGAAWLNYYDDSVTRTPADKFNSRGIISIDVDGKMYILYRLYTTVSTDKLRLTVANSDGTFSTFYNITTTPINTTDINNCYDIVAKDGEITIFYTLQASPSVLRKATLIVTSGDAEAGNYLRANFTGTHQYDLVVDMGAKSYFKYFAAYRKYESNSSKRLSYCIATTDTTGQVFCHLHCDIGLYNASGSSVQQVTPVWPEEPLMPRTNFSAQQILIIQASDNRLYKRLNYQYVLLEGQRKIDNSGWQWTTVFDDHMRTLQYGGILRILAGCESTARNGVYQYIDRYFFNNDAANRYQDYHSDYQRPAPPPTGTFTVTSITLADVLGLGYTQQELYDLGWRPFASVGDTEIFNPYLLIPNSESPRAYAEFFTAMSFEYDDIEESQLLYQTPDTPYILGAVQAVNAQIYQYLQFHPSIKSWQICATGMISPRLTALNCYMGIKNTIADTKYTVQYYKVKRLLVSRTKPTGENAFGNDALKGTAIWSISAAGVATPHDIPDAWIDFNMWQAGLAAAGTAEANLGTALTQYKSTGSGTELYTKDTMIPEAYKFGIVLQNEIYALGVRLAGVTRPNRLMKSARRLGSIVTPDAFTDDMGTNYDFSYDGQGIAHIDDSTLVIKGTHGTDIFDISGGILRKRDEITDIGTTKPDSVYSIAEGAAGDLIKGVLSQDPLGHIRLFDGYAEQPISDPIRDDFDTLNYGVKTLKANIKQIIYVPLYRCLLVSYGTQIFVFDLEGGKNWQDWRFVAALNASCVGVDGEVFFTDNTQVYVWPDAGAIDSPDPQWRELDVANNPDERLIPKDVWMDFIATGTTLQPKVWKDRGSATNSTNTLAVSATQVRRRTGYLRSGSSAMRETAIGFGVTTAANLTALEVDSIVQQFLVMKRRP